MTRKRARLLLSVLSAIWLGAGLMFGLSGMVWADDESSFSLQGFGTLGAARTTTKEARFVRDL